LATAPILRGAALGGESERIFFDYVTPVCCKHTFVYESFYASVSRDGFSIHLKCAPKTVADRTHRKQNEHLDAHVGVRGIEALFDELKSKGAHIIRPLEERPWGCKDFYVEDLDGYLLCFSEETA